MEGCSESHPVEDEEEEESLLGIKNLEEITQVDYSILIAHMFLKLTFNASLSCLLLFLVVFSISRHLC
jgi:hypothetical protein